MTLSFQTYVCCYGSLSICIINKQENNIDKFFFKAKEIVDFFKVEKIAVWECWQKRLFEISTEDIGLNHFCDENTIFLTEAALSAILCLTEKQKDAFDFQMWIYEIIIPKIKNENMPQLKEHIISLEQKLKMKEQQEVELQIQLTRQVLQEDILLELESRIKKQLDLNKVLQELNNHITELKTQLDMKNNLVISLEKQVMDLNQQLAEARSLTFEINERWCDLLVEEEKKTSSSDSDETVC